MRRDERARLPRVDPGVTNRWTYAFPGGNGSLAPATTRMLIVDEQR
jgi:hypothetical protein